MAGKSQATFSNALSSVQIVECRLKYHWSLFPKAQLTTSQYWFRQWLGAVRRQAITWTNADPVSWRIYAGLGEDELMTSFDIFAVINKLSRCPWPGMQLRSSNVSDSKVREANKGPVLGQHDPGGRHVGPMKLVIWGCFNCVTITNVTYHVICRLAFRASVIFTDRAPCYKNICVYDDINHIKQNNMILKHIFLVSSVFKL